MQTVFCDSEELSEALKHTRVSAMQIDKGRFEAVLSHLSFAGWSVQSIEFRKGVSVCSGDSPSDRHAVVVPLQHNQRSRLLGRTLGESTIGLYAPGSEHADVTFAEHEIAVLVPPPSLLALAREGEVVLPVKGSHLRVGASDGLTRLKQLLRRLPASQLEFETLEFGESQRSLCDSLTLALLDTLRVRGDNEASPASGRPQLPRSVILKRVSEILGARRDEPIYATELAAEVGISQPSLQRVFQELFGMSPARYLVAKRMYLARKRLREGRGGSVTEVASSLGFWDLSRFAKSYKDLFLELPSDTLRAGRKS